MTGTKNALNVTGSTHATAQPGVYTSISVSGAGTLALAPGDYVLAGGNLTGSGSAVITGSHVTIFLTCASYPTPCPTGATGAGLNLSGNSQLTLAGAADTSGISVFADRHNTAPASVTGSAPATITGHLYAPATSITVSGNTVLTVIGTLAVNQLAVAGSSKVADTAPAHVLPSASFTYDAAHRLTQATTGAGTSTYTYDGGGLRATAATSGTASQFAWALGAGIPLMLTDGATSYLYDDTGTPIEHIDAAGNTAYYQHDQYGSTRLLTNQTGTVVATYTYDAYGTLSNRTGAADTPLRWNGQQQDATGLYYLLDRYYDPIAAQFVTRDPLAAVTLSPYGYAAGSPVNAADPTGLDWCWQTWQFGFTQDSRDCWTSGYSEAFHHPLQALAVVGATAALVFVTVGTAGLDLPLLGGAVLTVDGGEAGAATITYAAGSMTLAYAAGTLSTGAAIADTVVHCLGTAVDRECLNDVISAALGSQAVLDLIGGPEILKALIGELSTLPGPC